MNKTLLVTFIILFVFNVKSQVYTAEDGTEIEVLEIDGNPGNMHRLNLFLGILMEGPEMDVSRFVRVGCFLPEIGSAMVSAGRNSVAGDLNVFLLKSYKEGFVRNTLKTDMDKRYVGKLPVLKQISVAPHIAGNYFKDPYTQFYQFCSGVSLVMTKQLSVKTDVRTSRGESLFRLNLDAVITRPTGNIDELKYTYNSVGVRSYVDGRWGGWSGKGYLSFNYMLGAFYDMDFFHVMAGAGLGINLK